MPKSWRSWREIVPPPCHAISGAETRIHTCTLEPSMVAWLRLHASWITNVCQMEPVT